MEPQLYRQRHSLAHLLAQAILRSIDPAAQFGTGPAIDDGCYYDIGLSDGITFSESQTKDLTKTMTGLVKENQTMTSYTTNQLTQAHDIIDMINQPLKHELIEKFAAQGETKYSFWANVVAAGLLPRIEKTTSPAYFANVQKRTARGQEQKIITDDQCIVFLDLCEGNHVESTAEIPEGSFVVDKIAGAYRQNNAENQMLTRIYVLAFPTKDELKAYQTMMEEARKRDHRKLGKELDLFIFSDLVGPGLPLYTGRGAIVRREIIKFSNELQAKIGYDEVHTPNMNKAALFKISGHYDKYKDDMFQVVSNYTDEEYFLKPMNCPQHTQLYASRPRSYKDLPIRFADFANLYRDERPGELSGLTRLRCFCQDDGHCFCREDQIEQEIDHVLHAIQTALSVYGMNYYIRLSLWDPQNKEKYLGDEKTREKSQAMLEATLQRHKIEYVKVEGEAAFYGPKLDIITKDSLRREWQISTIQLDFILPSRFGLEYIDSDGTAKTPAMIHRAITGSPERFLAILIEHFAGAFPVWLAPEQVKIIPVADAFEEYCFDVKKNLTDAGVRVSVDTSDDSFSKKIRNAELMKVPYILILGEKEMTDQSVSVRVYKTKEQYVKSVSEFVSQVVSERDERVL